MTGARKAIPSKHRPSPTPGADLSAIDEIQRRALWLATRIVDAANRERATGDGVKVGGHQSSSASLVTVMATLWFDHLNRDDRVSVKPHASPVFHAIQYLLGNLDRSYLTTLRSLGGLQSYPSRTKDPDREYIDFSTGSVGLGAAAPLFAAVARRYVDAHFGDRGPARFIALIGDAELDEGNVWEAVCEPATQGLGNVMWVVDFNRQSLDRVVPGVRVEQWRKQFEAAGWHVVEVKYGARLGRQFAAPGGDALRGWLDRMSNEQYQSTFAVPATELRARFLDGAPEAVEVALASVEDSDLRTLLHDLGGHDAASLLDAYAQCDGVRDRPSVVFAYTIKGWGLPVAGHPRNHSAHLSIEQIELLRESLGLTPETEWDRLDPATPAGALVERRRLELQRTPTTGCVVAIRAPDATGIRPRRPMSTQEAFGQVLVDLSRDTAVAPYLVTTAPDVATSTNLAGFINRVGVFSPRREQVWTEDGPLKWVEGPSGQHIELGISEMNLFMLLGQLGLTRELSLQALIPVGTVYDPFVCRGLDAFIHAVYSGARFIVAGTPSGVTLAPEGGAHQSIITPSIGLELPGTTLIEPAYAQAVDWLLCDAVADIGAPPDEGRQRGAYYFRLSTRPLDTGPFEAARARLGDEMLRRRVLDGAYGLVDASEMAGRGAPAVTLVGTGAVMPEVLEAAAELAEEGIAAHVIDVTSADRIYSAWHDALRHGVRSARTPSACEVLRAVFPKGSPIVTVHDAASHSMAWLGSALGVSCVPLGVDQFGQSGSVHDLYELNGLLPAYIVNAALLALDL